MINQIDPMKVVEDINFSYIFSLISELFSENVKIWSIIDSFIDIISPNISPLCLFFH